MTPAGRVQAGEERWYAVHTKPRQEHIAEEHLKRQDFRCYLPRAWNPSQRLPSQNPRVEPLFPRYLFVQVNTALQHIGCIQYTRGVARLVKFGHELAQVPEWVVEQLDRATDAVSGLVNIGRPPVGPGDEVEVFEGAFAGLKGIFQAADGATRAILLLNLLGREHTVSVENHCLKAAR